MISKQEQELIDDINKLGFGRIYLPVHDGKYDRAGAQVVKKFALDKGGWRPRVPSGIGELNDKQLKLLEIIRETRGEAVYNIDVCNGNPLNIEQECAYSVMFGQNH